MKKLFLLFLSVLLLSCQKLPDIFSRDKVTLLPISAMILEKDDTVQLQEYIDDGIDLDKKDGIGNTLLINAAYHNAIDCTKLLIKNGADIDIQGFNGETALMMSCTLLHYDIAKILIDAGANVNIKTRFGSSALPRAIASARKDTTNVKLSLVNLLIKNGANVNSRDVNGVSPLGLAKFLMNEKGYTKLDSILIKAGARE